MDCKILQQAILDTEVTCEPIASCANPFLHPRPQDPAGEHLATPFLPLRTPGPAIGKSSPRIHS
jgi:hypothetical protein